MTTPRYGFVCAAVAVLLAFGLLRHSVPRPVHPPPEAARLEESASDTAEVHRVHRLRIRAKDHLVAELVAGRRSLVGAAALFRELDRIPPVTFYPETDPDPPLRIESPTDDERYCVRVIRYARESLGSQQPDLSRAVTARLVDEFWAEWRERGAILLPDAPPESVRELVERP